MNRIVACVASAVVAGLVVGKAQAQPCAARLLGCGDRQITHAPRATRTSSKRSLLQPYPCGTSPCIDPIFGPTASNRYWSRSFSVPYAVQEWAVEFSDGGVQHLPPGIRCLCPGGASRLVIASLTL
jgi:hypothetical protein